MVIKTIDNKIITGDSPGDVCHKLWRSMLKPNKTITLWMLGNAKRALNWNGALVRTSSLSAHLTDLIRYNIVIMVKE